MRVIVFVARGCPAGWLGAYGNEWVGTPNLDRLAAESVVFDRHVSDRPDAAAAAAAWLGGSPALPALASLRAAGVRTVLVRANHPDTDGPDWFYAGWGEVFDARPREQDHSPLDALIRDLPAFLDRLAATPDFLLWIETDRLLPPWDVRQDVFDAYLEDEEGAEPDESEVAEEESDETDEQDGDAGEGEDDELSEPEDSSDHGEPPTPAPDATITEGRVLNSQSSSRGNGASAPTPEEGRPPPWYDPPTGPFDAADPDAWEEWLHATFAAVVTSLDAELGLVFDQLRARGLDESAAWLLTSDFGYPLGEHGQIGLHRPWLHEELVHLPLVLRLPNAEEAGRRVAGFTQPPDLPATLLDLFGLKPPEAASLLPLARGEAESRRAFAVSALELNGAAELALRTPEWAYLLPVRVPEGETREPMLFEKPDDRWEVNDLRARNVERADELETQLKRAAQA
jgi:arylsulfatase A-like enzyme